MAGIRDSAPADMFPERFTTVSPSAVEPHANLV